MTRSTARTFANHRGVVPMLWVLVTLAGFELAAVHLLLSLWWPTLARVLSALSLLSFLWLVAWVLSWKRRPHELLDDRLRLHMGSLCSIEVPLTSIERITGEVPLSVVKARDTRNLVAVAHPNRLIELRAPLQDRRGTRRIAIRLDDPVAFDEAMRSILPAGGLEPAPKAEAETIFAGVDRLAAR